MWCRILHLHLPPNDSTAVVLWVTTAVVENGIMIQQPTAACIDAFSNYMRWMPETTRSRWSWHNTYRAASTTRAIRSVVMQARLVLCQIHLVSCGSSGMR